MRTWKLIVLEVRSKGGASVSFDGPHRRASASAETLSDWSFHHFESRKMIFLIFQGSHSPGVSGKREYRLRSGIGRGERCDVEKKTVSAPNRRTGRCFTGSENVALRVQIYLQPARRGLKILGLPREESEGDPDSGASSQLSEQLHGQTASEGNGMVFDQVASGDRAQIKREGVGQETP